MFANELTLVPDVFWELDRIFYGRRT